MKNYVGFLIFFAVLVLHGCSEPRNMDQFDLVNCKMPDGLVMARTGLRNAYAVKSKDYLHDGWFATGEDADGNVLTFFYHTDDRVIFAANIFTDIVSHFAYRAEYNDRVVHGAAESQHCYNELN